MPTNLDHPCIIVPPLETPIWRYMQFPKFVSMLLSKSLFFTRCDRFDDPWEGSWTNKNLDKGWIVRAQLNGGATPEAAEKFADLWVRDLPQISRNIRRDNAVSCWHMNRTESDAFWRIYSRMDEGIAVRSSVGNLNDALSEQNKREVFFSVVTYLDYREFAIPMSNVFFPITHKRDSFKHENEFRAIIGAGLRSPGITGEPFDSDHGEAIPADLEKMILEIVVSPLAPLWFVEDVRTVIKRLGFSFPCRKSDLLMPPA